MSCAPCLVSTLFALVAISVSSAFASDEPFVIDDYFKLQRVTELALSSDGEMIAYAVERQSLDENKAVRAVYVSAATPDAESAQGEVIQDARGLAWIPGKLELAFLSDRNGTAQVFSYDIKSKVARRHTDSADPVTQFRFSPNGALAYITQGKSDTPSLYEQFQTGEKGLLIDPGVLRSQHFTDPNWVNGDQPPSHLWLMYRENTAQVELPGEPVDIHWSPDSTKLAVTYASRDLSTSYFANYRTGVGVYDVVSGRFRVPAAPIVARLNVSGLAYRADGWLGADKLIIHRAKINDLFVSPRHPEWTVIDASADDPLAEKNLTWRELSLTGLDRPPLFHTLADRKVLINKTIRGGYRSLYEAKESGTLERADIAHEVDGNISMIRFNASGNRAVFVHDSLDRPAEIYLWRQGEGVAQLTQLNQTLANRRLPVARAVEWKSKDGTRISGWLLLPAAPAKGQAPWPLITFVHGGPSLPMPAGFAEGFSFWPYPLETYAVNGIAVFLVNYRGNTTFGRAFADPDREDGQPVDDIIAGVEHLIEEGVADPKRLAISGHSHGAWLAPLVMTRYKKFQAASFADGWGNDVTVYELTPGRLNRELHDDLFGASLYDDPKRYLRLSPVLHFKGLKTAALFEAGNQSGGISMMSYPKAARYAGMPAEFVIYPQTGHNPSRPSIQRESAMRNLDWFRFWLQGYEDPNPEKEDQYARWRKMRLERCTWDEPEGERPSYCEYSTRFTEGR